MIRRREFIAVLGSTAAWPLAARALNVPGSGAASYSAKVVDGKILVAVT